MAARLLVGHHPGPDAERVEIVARLVQQAVGRGLQHPRHDALAHQAALAIAAVGIEAETDHRLAVALHVGDDGHPRAGDRKSTRLNYSHYCPASMTSSAG